MKSSLTSLPNCPDQLKKIILSKDNEISSLVSQISLLLRDKFGKKSEKWIDPNQPGLFNEAEVHAGDSEGVDDGQENKTTISTRTRRGKRKPLPEGLPRRKTIHDLEEAQKLCPHTGKALFKIGESTREQLEIIPQQVFVNQDVAYKYACRCCDETFFAQAAMPGQVIPKSMASNSLLSYVAVSKYADCLPLYRLENMFKRCGVDLGRATMARWMIRLSSQLAPLVNLMKEDLLSASIVHADETTIQVLKEKDRDPSSKSYFWALAREGPDICVFHYDQSRRSAVALDLLEGYAGHLMVDGYDGYNAACKQSAITRIGCWAHVRRYFFNAVKAMKKSQQGTLLANHALSKIRKLYKVETDSKGLSVEQIKALRQRRSIPILEGLEAWLRDHLQTVPASTLTGKALNYMSSQWNYLTDYAKTGHLPFDNNLLERHMKSFALGRKNWLFADTPKGADASAIIYSLLVTAKMNKLNPYEYLRNVLENLPTADTAQKIEELLPYNIKVNVD